jgi:serine/threonine protein phosphatase PrpC
MMKNITYYGQTDVGNKRTVNEDSLWPPAGQRQHPYAASPYGQLYVVADGLGGQGSGDIASRLAVNAIRDAYYDGSNPEPSIAVRLERAVQAAHRAIREASTTASTERMGTTVVAVAIRDGVLWVAWVGDSRAYLVRNGTLIQLTQDHSELWELIQADQISWQELHYHPRRSKLTNSLSVRRTAVAVSQNSIELRPGDRILLCTDGLTSEVPEQRIQQVVATMPLPEAVRTLISEAKARKTWLRDGQPVVSVGGEDNITICLVQLPGGRGRPVASGYVRYAAAAAAVLVLVVLVGLLSLARPFGALPEPTLAAPGETPVAAMSATAVVGAAGPTPTPTVAESRAATKTATPMPTATAAGTASATATATATATEPSTPAPPPTHTAIPTQTPTAQPTPPTETPAPSPTATPRPTSTLAQYPTPTPVPPSPTSTPARQITPTIGGSPTVGAGGELETLCEKLGDIILISPEDGYNLASNVSEVTFEWRWGNGCDALPQGYYFEIRIGLDGPNATRPGAMDARLDKPRIQCVSGMRSFEMADVRKSKGMGGATTGIFRWDVAIVTVDPKYDPVCPSSESRRLILPGTGGGDTGGGSSSPRIQ